MTSVLHTWGSALTHHPHVHIIVPGGGLSPDGTRWIGCFPGCRVAIHHNQSNEKIYASLLPFAAARQAVT